MYKYFSTCEPALHPVYWDCSKKCFSIQRQNPSYNKEIRPMSIDIPSILCSSVPFGKSICPEPKRPMLKFFSNACTLVLSKCVHVPFVFSLSYRSMYDVAFSPSLLPLLPSSSPPCPYFSPLPSSPFSPSYPYFSPLPSFFPSSPSFLCRQGLTEKWQYLRVYLQPVPLVMMCLCINSSGLSGREGMPPSLPR